MTVVAVQVGDKNEKGMVCVLYTQGMLTKAKEVDEETAKIIKLALRVGSEEKAREFRSVLGI